MVYDHPARPSAMVQYALESMGGGNNHQMMEKKAK
jgi:hypothetical protein